MKFRTTLWLLIILLLSSCKEQNKKRAINSRDELFIGKEFYSGDELDTYTFIISNNIKENDSLTCSIYKNNDGEGYLFSVERLASNEDKEKYKIIDLLRFTNYDSANHKVEVMHTAKGYAVLFLDKEKILKKWEFKLNSSNVNQIWVGKYDGNFLRIKEESADSRAYATIVMNIENNKATFRLDSYNENLISDLLILSSNHNNIVFCEKDDKDSKFSITKNNNEFILTSDLLDETTGEVKTYKLKKN